MDVLYMAAHYPLNSHDHDHSYPEQHILTVDMVQNELQQKPHPFPQALLPQYTSSPSMDSQADDDERLFDVDVDFANIPSDNHHLPYDNMSSPPWASIATPRAWVGEAHKLPALEPDSRRSSFIFPMDNMVTQQDSSSATNSSVSNIYNLDFLENGSPVRSPPIPYLTTPGSVGVSTAMLSNTYYSESHQHSPSYALASRYNSTMALSDPGCDPRFVNSASVSPNAGPSSSPDHESVGISFADVYSDPSAIKVEQEQHSSLIGPGDMFSAQQITHYETDSGEDEKSESESDPSYMPSSSRLRPMSLPTSTRIPSRHMRSSSAGSGSLVLGNAPQRPTRTPAPEPVPNLTKKSRGRRVPTAAALYSSSYSTAGSMGNKNVRTYVCKVKDCGKCFARSEHLKRHVRSIHTNEKPHRCPHSGCNKEFSRHDNLCQHMRVHRNFSASKDGTYGSF